MFAELKCDEYLGEDPFSNINQLDKHHDELLLEMDLGKNFTYNELFTIFNIILEENLSNCKQFVQNKGLSPSKILTNTKESINVIVLHDNLIKEEIKMPNKNVVDEPCSDRQPIVNESEGKKLPDCLKLR
jgi:hypothetical protein